MADRIPRLFILRRDQDVTGVSGPGDVADGVQWADGSVVLRWRERPSTAVWDSLDLMLSVHGHDGATCVVWADAENRARAAAGRAYQLADRWEAAHGSSMFLVRVAGAELRDALDEDAGGGCDNTSHGAHAGFTCAEVQSKPYWNVRWAQEHARKLYAAAECSAQHHGFDDGPRQCIRAAQHRGDHIDEHGFHWSDTVAVYPVDTGEIKVRPAHVQGPADAADCPGCVAGALRDAERLSRELDKAEGAIARVRALRNRARSVAPEAAGPTWKAIEDALDGTEQPTT